MTDEYLVEKNFYRIKKSSNNIILFGEVGCGKTTLVNKLCGVDLLTKDSGYSCTRNVQFAATPDNSLVIDFPGLSAAEDVVNHIKKQKSTLKIIPARIICFVIKYERYDLIQKKAIQMYKIFHEHKENICVIITFSEKLKSTHKDEIQYIFKTKLQIPNKNVIFSSLYTSSSEILKKLNVCKNSVSNIKSINFSERSLIDTAGKEGVSMELIELREEEIKKYNKAVDTFRKEFNKANEYSLKFALYYSFRDYKDTLLDNYSNIVKSKVLDIDTAVVEIITFNNELYEAFNKITERFEAEMKVESENYNGDKNNRYKRCPHCGKIWFKVSGCNNVRCGNRTKRKDVFVGRFKTYFVRFDGVTFNITTLKDEKVIESKDDVSFGLTEKEKEENKSRWDRHLIQPEGCGANLDWAKLEDVTEEVEKILKKTYADRTYDLKMKDNISELDITI